MAEPYQHSSNEHHLLQGQAAEKLSEVCHVISPAKIIFSPHGCGVKAVGAAQNSGPAMCNREADVAAEKKQRRRYLLAAAALSNL
jgi:hypothetical protein